MKVCADIVIGCEQLGGTDWGLVDQSDIQRAISEAFDLGLTAFDTADVYGLGQSELRLAAALGHRRKDAFIVTKGGVRWEETGGRARTHFDNSPAYISKAIDASLSRLGVDYIDLYFVHWPDGITPLDAVLDCLREAKEIGKIAAYGLSNFPASAAIMGRDAGLHAVQMSFNLLSSTETRADLAKLGRAGITRYGYGALAQGLLAGKYGANSRFNTDDRRHRLPHFQKESWQQVSKVLRVLEDIAAATEESMPHLAIQALRQSNLVDKVIVGIKTTQQARELAALSKILIDEAPLRQLLTANEVV